jgi:hypothetical protein
MSRDVQDRLELYSDGPVTVHRVALNHDQVLRHELPPDPAKWQDSRAADYIAKYGEYSWELDALDPTTLASIVENAIKQLVDLEKWRAAEKAQQAAQDKLQDVIDNLTV